MAAREIAFAAAAPLARAWRAHATCAVRGAPRMGSRKAAAEAEAVRVAVLRGVEKAVAERAVAAVVRAARGLRCVSEFLTPDAAHEVCMSCRRAMPDARVVAWGGFEGAERCVLTAGHAREFEDDAAVVAAVSSELAAVEMRGAFAGSKLSQRDFLGAVLDAVRRERVGDVLLGEEAAYAVVHAEVAELLVGAVTSVGKTSVETRVVELADVTPTERRVKEFTTVEKSLRLDAVGSAGFGISRAKMAEGIRGGGVKVNHREVLAPAKMLKEGDMVSLRGRGRIEIGECGQTRKGNIRVTILRYL